MEDNGMILTVAVAALVVAIMSYIKSGRTPEAQYQEVVKTLLQVMRETVSAKIAIQSPMVQPTYTASAFMNNPLAPTDPEVMPPEFAPDDDYAVELLGGPPIPFLRVNTPEDDQE